MLEEPDMTMTEYNELVDQLHYGHEVEFKYTGKTYYLEVADDNTYEFYDITDINNAVFLQRIIAENTQKRVEAFLNAPLIEGKAFDTLYPYIEYADID